MFGAEVPEADIEAAVTTLCEKYSQEQFAMEVVKAGNGYQFMTKPAYQASIGILLKQTSRKKLSRAALETLSIVAYKQPVTKPQIEQIRGVNCDYAIRKLLEKELVELKGKSESVGKPLLYGTTDKFLEYFGIDHLGDLPAPKDFKDEENEIGENEDSQG